MGYESIEGGAVPIKAWTHGVLAEAIRPLGRVSSGVLYAHVCGRMSLETYEAALGMLRRAKLVSENAHVLAWIGPTPGVKP